MKFGSLEALRGIAALAVALYHSSFVIGVPGPYFDNAPLFVDFFFVLSGFVIAHAYYDRIAAGYSATDFALLRLGRIFPVHLAMLAAWAVYLATIAAGSVDLLGLAANLVLLNSIGLTPDLSWNYPSWSVGAEMLAYLTFFGLVAGLRARFTPAIAMAVALAAYTLLIGAEGRTVQRTFDLGALRCVAGFFLGVAVQMVWARLKTRACGTTGEAAAIVLVAVLLGQPAGSIATELATIAGFALVVFVFAGSQGAVSRGLNLRVPVFLGRISYSIYMLHALVFLIAFGVAEHVWHLPREVTFNAAGIGRILLSTPWAWAINAGLLSVTILLAALCWRAIEDPCRRASRRYVAARGQGALRAGSAAR